MKTGTHKGTYGFNGESLREVIVARGFTSAFVADSLNVSRQSMSNYITGRNSPNPDLVDRICRFLNIPESFLLKESTHDKTEQKSPRFYRSFSAATKNSREMAEIKLEWLIELINFLEIFIELPTVKFPKFDTPSDPTRISNEFIEAVAIRVRQFWGLGTGPISNFVWLLENNGAVVVRRQLHAKTLDAFSCWQGGRPYIILGMDKNCAVRSRFDAAHELGHLILHNNLPEICVRSSKYFKMGEEQANRFAGAILFPQEAFFKEIKRPNLEIFRLSKRRWMVSIAMMIKRAEHLEYISEDDIKTLWVRYSNLKWRTNEPLDDELEVEQPKLVKNIIDLAINEGLLSTEEISNYLHLFHSDIEDCVGLPNNYLDPKAFQVIELNSWITRHKQEVKNVPSSDQQLGTLIPFQPKNNPI